MEKEAGKDISRRRFLTGAAALLGAVGAAFAAVPFIRAMAPTKDILATGVQEVDISTLGLGELRTVVWRKQPVFILRRTAAMMEQTRAMDPGALIDPASPEEREQEPGLFVAIGICTHLGCVPKFMDRVPESGFAGFYCPCHGGKYDSLGRRVAGPPPENLRLLPYRTDGQGALVIGSELFGGYGEGVRKVQELPRI